MDEGLRNDVNRLLRQFTAVMEQLRRNPQAMAECKSLVLTAIASNPDLLKGATALLNRRQVTQEPAFLTKAARGKDDYDMWRNSWAS